MDAQRQIQTELNSALIPDLSKIVLTFVGYRWIPSKTRPVPKELGNLTGFSPEKKMWMFEIIAASHTFIDKELDSEKVPVVSRRLIVSQRSGEMFRKQWEALFSQHPELSQSNMRECHTFAFDANDPGQAEWLLLDCNVSLFSVGSAWELQLWQRVVDIGERNSKPEKLAPLQIT